MLTPLAIGKCTLKADVSEESSTSTTSGSKGRKVARGTSRANVSPPAAITERVYHRALGGRSRSKTG